MFCVTIPTAVWSHKTLYTVDCIECFVWPYSRWYGHTKHSIQSTSKLQLGSATLSLLAFLMKSDPNSVLMETLPIRQQNFKKTPKKHHVPLDVRSLHFVRRKTIGPITRTGGDNWRQANQKVRVSTVNTARGNTAEHDPHRDFNFEIPSISEWHHSSWWTFATYDTVLYYVVHLHKRPTNKFRSCRNLCLKRTCFLLFYVICILSRPGASFLSLSFLFAIVS